MRAILVPFAAGHNFSSWEFVIVTREKHCTKWELYALPVEWKHMFPGPCFMQ